ncbi:MAG: inorganic phosphate transporter [Candidatus Zhuqueibacterota bacterium]
MVSAFLISGLFLGWSLGANDAGNVFGTAVATKMLRFKTAAAICSVFVILGAAFSGAGASHTLERLGSVNAIAGSFIVALAAAITTFFMTRIKIPVSSSQGIVGAIIGWNFFAGYLTDFRSLTTIILTWILCPALSAAFAIVLFLIMKAWLSRLKIHMLQMDMLTRVGLIIVGAFGSYTLGANNIANVMGVFVPVADFPTIHIAGFLNFTGTQLLFALGGFAIAAGVFTYSHKVMDTVGKSLFKLSPIAALIVVLAHSIVLFLFSSEGLGQFLASIGLPSIPLVPVSSTQAIVGAVIGIGILKGGRQIKFKILGGIALGWVTTPIMAGLVAFLSLFIFQNVFDQQVYRKVSFDMNEQVIRQLNAEGIVDTSLVSLQKTEFKNPARFESVLRDQTTLNHDQRKKVIEYSFVESYRVNPRLIDSKIDSLWFTPDQMAALRSLAGKTYSYRWQFVNDLQRWGEAWRFRDETKFTRNYNKDLQSKFEFLFEMFRVDDEAMN